MNYIITGSEGFIGKNLIKSIKEHNNWSHKEKNTKIISIDSKVNQEKNTYYIIGHVENINEFAETFFNRTNITLYHLAAMSSPVEVADQPFEAIKSNLLGTAAVLEFARRKNILHTIIASSSAVTGRSLYGWTKKSSEYLAEYYMKYHKLNVAYCRFFNTFGNNENKGKWTSIPTQFLDRAMKDENIIIYGNGKQSRDFIYIKDLVEWLWSLHENKRTSRFDFGTGISTSYNSLAEMIIRLTNSKSKIIHIKNRLKNYQTFTKASFPYSTPKYTLESALQDMINERRILNE